MECCHFSRLKTRISSEINSSVSYAQLQVYTWIHKSVLINGHTSPAVPRFENLSLCQQLKTWWIPAASLEKTEGERRSCWPFLSLYVTIYKCFKWLCNTLSGIKLLTDDKLEVISIAFGQILLRSTTPFDGAETRQKSSRVFEGIRLLRIMIIHLKLIILFI